MVDKILYRYNRKDGGITVSLEEPSTEYIILHRLIADEGMILTDGNINTPCIDTEFPQSWREVVDFTAEKYSDPFEELRNRSIALQ